jgi:hypothetical protein
MKISIAQACSMIATKTESILYSAVAKILPSEDFHSLDYIMTTADFSAARAMLKSYRASAPRLLKKESDNPLSDSFSLFSEGEAAIPVTQEQRSERFNAECSKLELTERQVIELEKLFGITHSDSPEPQ